MVSTAIVLGLGCVLGGCQFNMWALEEVVTHPQGKRMGLVITMLQCAFICLVSLFDYALVWKKKSDRTEELRRSTISGGPITTPMLIYSSLLSRIPIRMAERELDSKQMLGMGLTFAFMSLTNNACYNYNISVPFHTVFRSGSLAVSVLMGICIFGKKYSKSQLLCSALVTAGVVVFSLAAPKKNSVDGGENSVDSSGGVSAMGIALLVCTSVAGPVLGLQQANLFAQAEARTGVKKQRYKEAVFYGHLISGSVLLLLYGRETYAILADFPPELIKPMTANLISQLVCVRGVYALASVVSSFNVALTLVIRKMITLVFSLVYYGHYDSFTTVHYVSMLAAFGGAILYTFLPGTSAVSSAPANTKKDLGKMTTPSSVSPVASRRASSASSKQKRKKLD